MLDDIPFDVFVTRAMLFSNVVHLTTSELFTQNTRQQS